MDAESSKQPSVAVLPVDSLEKTLQVNIDVQSFINEVLSQAPESTPKHSPSMPSPSVPPPPSMPRLGPQLLILQYDSLAMALKDLGLNHDTVAIMKTARRE